MDNFRQTEVKQVYWVLIWHATMDDTPNMTQSRLQLFAVRIHLVNDFFSGLIDL